MMKRLALLLAFASALGAQTLTTLTGTIKDLSGSTVTSGRIVFTTTLNPGQDLTIPGVGRFVPSTTYCRISNSGQPVSNTPPYTAACQITKNTALSPSGTSYATCVQPYNVQPGGCFNFFATLDTVDISTIAPTPTTLPTNYAGMQGPPFDVQGAWLSTFSYRTGQVATYNNAVYMSLLSPNLNHIPSSSPTYWEQISLPGSVVVSPTLDQTIAQPDGTSFTPNRQNGVVYNVREWCATPGVLDDTCFSRAITNIASHGFVGYAGHIYAELVVSPEIYTFAHQVTIPAGINIGIHGTMESGVYGSTVNTDASDAFLVLSDNVDIQHISFFGTPAAAAKHNGIVLGSSTVEVFDSHINWNWFINQNYAIRAVNVSGLDISHNTWDSGTSYGFFSDSTAGDVKVQDIIAVGVRGFNEINVFKIHGDGTDNYSDILIDGIFDNTQAGDTAIDINNVRSVKITGNFNNNPYDILLTGVNGAVVGPFTGHNNYLESIRVVSSNNVGINNGSYTNVGLGQSASGYLIDVTGSNGTIVHAVSSISTNGTPTGNVLNGLHIDATSTGSDVFANNLKAQTGAAEVNLDASTLTPMSGIKVGASVVNGVGLQHTRQSGCTTATSTGASCTTVITWPIALPNTNYTWSCSAEGFTGLPIIVGTTAKSSTAITLQITNLLTTGVASSVTLVNCIAAHD
jgi:hypothetical protein